VLIVAAALFAAALFFGVVGTLGLTERLRRNRFAGVRTPATLRDEAAFALANKIAAPTVLAAALLFAAGGAAALIFTGWLAVAAVIAAIAAAVLTAGAGSALGIRAAVALPEPAHSSCSSCTGCSLMDACAPKTA
jgi:uncharacterized membrane protein